MKYAEIGDDVYFWFAANTTAGAAGDGATPLYDVRLAGAAAGAAPVQSGTPTLLTHADYPDGIHEIKVDTDAFAAGEYAVFCSLTISTVNPAGFCGSFKLRTAGTAAFMVGLIDDAITAAKFDESTAFPLTSDGVTLTTGGIDAIFDRNSSLSISFETLINRIYQMINDKMEITDATGAVSLKDIAGTGEIATGNVSDDSTTTTRDGLTWV